MILKLILVITLCVPNLRETEQAYERTLGYALAGHGRVSSELSREWGAPAMSGHEYVLLQPASAAHVYLRMIQTVPVEGYRPMTTLGWNAIEMMVQDPDALAGKIRKSRSGFDLVGEPRPLWTGSPIRAMQATGPAHEVLYLTKPPDAGDRPAARTFVDRPFIVVLGNRSLAEARHFWHDVLGVDSAEPLRLRISVLSKAFGLDPETTHLLSVARLSPDYAVELDQSPDGATERPHAPGELPPAMALVSFETDSLQAVSSLLLAPPEHIDAAPYLGRRAGTLRGPSGELIELIENEPTTRH